VGVDPPHWKFTIKTKLNPDNKTQTRENLHQTPTHTILCKVTGSTQFPSYARTLRSRGWLYAKSSYTRVHARRRVGDFPRNPEARVHARRRRARAPIPPKIARAYTRAHEDSRHRRTRGRSAIARLTREELRYATLRVHLSIA
jgi:hypothetical protein